MPAMAGDTGWDMASLPEETNGVGCACVEEYKTSCHGKGIRHPCLYFAGM